MTTTNFNPKVAMVGPRDTSPVATDKAVGRAIGGDSFIKATVSDDPYSNLIAGRPKAINTSDIYDPSYMDDSSMLGELENNVNAEEARPRMSKSDQIDALLGELMGGDADGPKPKASDFKMPHVPDFNREIKRLPNINDNMPYVIRQYTNQEKIIKKLLIETKRDLGPENASKMTADENAALWDHLKDLQLLLADNRKQALLATDYMKKLESKKLTFTLIDRSPLIANLLRIGRFLLNRS